jgi:hypothetical protein
MHLQPHLQQISTNVSPSGIYFYIYCANYLARDGPRYGLRTSFGKANRTEVRRSCFGFSKPNRYWGIPKTFFFFTDKIGQRQFTPSRRVKWTLLGGPPRGGLSLDNLTLLVFMHETLTLLRKIRALKIVQETVGVFEVVVDLEHQEITRKRKDS